MDRTNNNNGDIVDGSVRTKSPEAQQHRGSSILPHDEVVIRELLTNGPKLSRVIELYAGRLAKHEVVAVARRLLVELGGSGADPRDRDFSDGEGGGGSGEIGRMARCDLGIGILRLSSSDLLAGSELLRHHLANLSKDAPEDFLDPVFSHIMRDPVVISSGFIVDRSTATKNGTGKLETCPWTRKPLNDEVYPALLLKRDLTEFKSRRIGEMMETASLLLDANNESDFCKVMELAQAFLDDVGPKGHRTLAKQISNMGLSTLSADGGKLSILSPSLLTRQLLMLFDVEGAHLDETFFAEKASKMKAITQETIQAKRFDEAEKWLACCQQIQDHCESVLSGDKEIPIAQMRLDCGKQQGLDNLLHLQRKVYQALVQSGRTDAIQDFLKNEGIRPEDLKDVSPCFFKTHDLQSSVEDDVWHEACRSSALEGEISHVVVSALSFQDQGWGNCKGKLGLALYSPNDELVTRIDLFGTYRTPDYSYGEIASRLLKTDEEIISSCRPGCYYRLDFTVGGGGGHSVSVGSLACKIFYKEWFAKSSNGCYRMHDPEGDAGVYLGTVNQQGVADGEGRLEYDDGMTFIGKFCDGSMLEGTVYGFGGEDAVFTMLEGKWVERDFENFEERAARYPLDTNNLTVDTFAESNLSDSETW